LGLEANSKIDIINSDDIFAKRMAPAPVNANRKHSNSKTKPAG